MYEQECCWKASSGRVRSIHMAVIVMRRALSGLLRSLHRVES